MKIAIAHAAFLDDRKASLDRLLKQLENEEVHLFSSAVPEHASVWARRLWEWAAGIDEPVCLLNDDVSVCPNLGLVCEAMSIACNRWPGPISLHTSVPEAVLLATQGFRFIRCYWLTGPGYVLRPGDARWMLNWMDQHVDIAKQINEDNVGIHTFYAVQQPILGCIPALVQHDVTVKSTLGYDNHALRQTPVPWDHPMFNGLELRDVNNWFGNQWSGADPNEAPWIQNPWMSVYQLEKIRRMTTSQISDDLCAICNRPPKVRAGTMTFCEACIHQLHVAANP